MPVARIPIHGKSRINCYTSDEHARKMRELREGAICIAAWLAGCAAIPALYYWMIHHA